MTKPYPHIDIIDGSPMIHGTRVPVRRLWAWFKRGTSASTLIKRYPQLGPAKVLTALAYAHDHEALVEEDLARENAVVEQAQRHLPF